MVHQLTTDYLSTEQDVIQNRNNISEFERYASAAIGGLLIYSSIRNFRKNPLKKAIRLVVGAAMVYRGASGYCMVYDKLNIDGRKAQSINARATLIINKPRAEVYKMWRNLNNLSLFMTHITNVNEVDNTQSEWEARIPLKNPVTIHWNAEIVKEIENELLAWKSVPGSKIKNAGKIEFRDALGKKGTEVSATIIYRPPAGNIGSGIAKIFNPMFEKIIYSDILNFKNLMDSGKIKSQ